MRKVVLAGICTVENSAGFTAGMQECRALCTACDMDVQDVITQNSRHMDEKTAFRSGKLMELKTCADECNAGMIVFYNDLRIQTAERVSDFCGLPVIDRTALILNIFSLHARTRQAKLQTEMARLKYDLPRVLAGEEQDSHQRGGAVTNRGSGEMRSRVIARQYAKRMTSLQHELSLIQKQYHQDENRRGRTMIKKAALVGYTNAGKSSLMNALLSESDSGGRNVEEKDALFATLDTSVRLMRFDKREYFLYDTVGFVTDLPPSLLDAFHTTLDSARNADLLIHVIDCSDPLWLQKKEAAEETLKQIGAGEIDVLPVYNKVDLASDPRRWEGMRISCHTREGIHELEEEIIRRLYPTQADKICLIPVERLGMLDRYKKVLKTEVIEEREEGLLVRLEGPWEYLHAFDTLEYGGKK